MTPNILILGAGPAGLAAAIQLQRAGLSPLVLEAGEPGGLLRNANLVENYPGFPQGIPGPELANLMVGQAQRLGVQLAPEKARRLAWEGERFWVETERGGRSADYLVIASGTRPRPFTDFPIPPQVADQVGYAVYPLRARQGQTIAIVGAGDAAFDYALNLAQRNRVLVLNRSAERKCLPLLWERAQEQPAIHYHPDVQIREIQPMPDGKIWLKCGTTGVSAGLPDPTVDYLLGALGRTPALDFAPPEFLEQAPGLVAQGRLYWAGDVCNGRYRQTAIAAGDGLRAAMQIMEQVKS